MGKNGKFLKWKISFHRNTPSKPPPQPPPEYLCPICNTLLSDPVVIPSGHTFDRLCIQACLNLNCTPTLPSNINPDFTTLIPNLALQSSIPNWCSQNKIPLPPQKDYSHVETIVKGLIQKQKDVDLSIRPSERILIDAVQDVKKPNLDLSHAVTELTPRVNNFNSWSSSSDESVIASATPLTPLPFTTRPACWSSEDPSSSSETLEGLNPRIIGADSDCSPDEEFISKFKSSDPFVQEQGVVSLRKITRNDEKARIALCTPRLLVVLRSMLVSSYEKIQSNAVASLVNLSLEKPNKLKIVRSGIVPMVIDLLKGRSLECQEHAAGAIFSLSLEDSNKTAIGVLGALPPLLHCLLRSDSERTRGDSSLALYHLSHVHSNRVKLVKLGAIPPLLTMLRSENDGISGRVLLVLCELAASSEGKAAMLDGNAVEHLVGMLKRKKNELISESTRENCVIALYGLSQGSMRFKALAKEVGMVEVLQEVEEKGGERAREKARRILTALKGRPLPSFDSGEEVDWEAILESGALSRTRQRVGGGCVGGKSTDF